MPERLNNVVPVYRALRHIGGGQVNFHSFLTSAPDEDEWSTTAPTTVPTVIVPVPIEQRGKRWRSWLRLRSPIRFPVVSLTIVPAAQGSWSRPSI